MLQLFLHPFTLGYLTQQSLIRRHQLRRSAFDPLLQLSMGFLQRLFGLLAFRDINPTTDDFDGIVLVAANEVELVAHPPVGSILVHKAVLHGMVPDLPNAIQLSENGGKIFWVDVACPETGVVDEFRGLVPEQRGNILADEGAGI